MAIPDTNELFIEDGKYTLVLDPVNLRALRYGKPWRDLTGDGFVMALGHEIQELLTLLDTAQDLVLDAAQSGSYDADEYSTINAAIARLTGNKPIGENGDVFSRLLAPATPLMF